MIRKHRRIIIMATWIAVGLPIDIARADDVQVNTYTTGSQIFPTVAADAEGNHVIVWQSGGSSGTDSKFTSIQGQLYARDGSRLGEEFQINTYTTSNQFNPSVARSEDGDFVVVWDGGGSSGNDTSARSVQAQRFASDGSRLGEEFQVNVFTTGFQSGPVVAGSKDGGFIVVWSSLGSGGEDMSIWSVQAHRFASDGSRLGEEFQVNTYTSRAQEEPSISADAEGRFVIVWHSEGSSGSDSSRRSIQGQRYASDGSRLGEEFQVNTTTLNDQDRPSVALSPAGDFVIVWRSASSGGTDNSGSSIQGQRYASDGSRLGEEFQVNTYITSTQTRPAVAKDVDGDFIVVWESFGSSDTDTANFSVQGQLFASDGSRKGAQFQVNTFTPSLQTAAETASIADNDFVITWTSFGSSGTDTNNSVQRTGNDPMLSFAKALLSTPVLPGGAVELEYTIANGSPASAATDLRFTDDFGTVIPGLEAVGLPQDGVCGAGSELTGSSIITLTGGQLDAGTSCVFSVTLGVPSDAAPGTYPSTTSELTGDLSGDEVSAPPATADLEIAFFGFSKSFDREATPGGGVGLSLTIVNPDPANGATNISFTDDLGAVVPGLEAVGLPELDVCGPGSQIAGTSILTLTGGDLGPSEACVFTVTLSVPQDAPHGAFTNVTSALEATVGGSRVIGGPADVATAILGVINPLSIPTLSEWALLLFAAFLALVATQRLRSIL